MLAEAAKAPPVAQFAGEAAEAQGSLTESTQAQGAAAQDADAHDEALLDMIAMEMGAPDPISDEEIAAAVAEQARLQNPSHPPLAKPEPVEPSIAPEPVVVPAPPAQQAVQPSPPGAIEPVTCASACSCARDGNVARLDHHRERDVAKAGCSGQRPAGADPAHEPGREDRVLLLTHRLSRLNLCLRNLPQVLVATALAAILRRT